VRSPSVVTQQAGAITQILTGFQNMLRLLAWPNKL
jgi:hypothetical protein